MKCKVCGNYVRLNRDAVVVAHYKDDSNWLLVLCPASGVGPGHPDHPDPLPDVTWEELDRGIIEHEPDQTYGVDDWS